MKANSHAMSLCIALATLLLGTLLSTLVYINAIKEDADDIRADFITKVTNRSYAMEKEFNYFFDQLGSIQSLFSIFPNVTEKEFAQFVRPILKKQKTIQALEWAPRIALSERETFEEAIRNKGLSHFKILENDNDQFISAGDRPVYYPILYAEPSKGNESAIGYDLGSNPIRLRAIEKAILSKSPVLTEKIQLIQEKKGAFGILLFFPVFTDQNELKGFVVGVLHLLAIIENLLQEFSPASIDISIYDKSSSSEDQLLYFFNSESWNPKNPSLSFSKLTKTDLSYSQQINIGDRSWEIIYQGTPNFGLGFAHTAIILIAGIAASFALATLTYHLIEKSKNLLNRKLLEEEVGKRTKELSESLTLLKSTQKSLVTQEKLASLGALTAGIAHEIKNPLNFINNFSVLCLRGLQNLDVILQKYLLPEIPEADKEKLIQIENTLKQNLTSINKQGQIANNIIHRMLDHSRLKTNEKASKVDIHALIDEYLNLSYHGMRSQNSKFNTKFEKFYDMKVSELEIFPSDIGRVLLNIFNNAYYAIIQKKNKLGEAYSPCLTVATKVKDQLFEISIKDNGLGIPETIASKLFTPFFTSKPSGEGTGLGLSLSRSVIVDEHRGTLVFNSKEGEYTEFIITLPLNYQQQRSESNEQ